MRRVRFKASAVLKRFDALDERGRLLLAHGEPMGQSLLLRVVFQRMPVRQGFFNGIQLTSRLSQVSQRR